MIKFFRNIRKTNLKEGKALNYLKYAIGEIVLIVIGILIALGINNWNENRKQHLSDIEFLKNLKNEIVLDTLGVSSKIKSYEGIDENIKTTLALIDSSKALTVEQTKFISNTLATAEFLLPTYKDLDRNGLMIASGAIKRIDQNLHNSYLKYLEAFKFSYDTGNKLANSLERTINNELYPSVDLNFTDATRNRVEFDLADLKDNRTFNNALQISIYYREAVINMHKPLLEEGKSLILQIEDKLKQQQGQ